MSSLALKYSELYFDHDLSRSLVNVKCFLCLDSCYRQAISWGDVCSLKVSLDNISKSINFHETYPGIFLLPKRQGRHRNHQWVLSRSAIIYGIKRLDFSGMDANKLGLSISHSNDIAAVVISGGHQRVGVDIENIKRTIAVDSIQRVLNLEDIKIFPVLDLWLLKEAVFKACNGYISDLRAIVVVKKIKDSLYLAIAGSMEFYVHLTTINDSFRISIAVENRVPDSRNSTSLFDIKLL